jgi:hypothetical protein
MSVLTRTMAYARGHAEGSEGKKTGSLVLTDGQIRLLVADDAKIEGISDQTHAWNVGFARGFRASRLDR